jgi:signal transduction histidine kinase
LEQLSPFLHLDKKDLNYESPDGKYSVELTITENYLKVKHKGYVDDKSMVNLDIIFRRINSALVRCSFDGDFVIINDLRLLTGGTIDSKREMKKIFKDWNCKLVFVVIGGTKIMKVLGRIFAMLSSKVNLHFVDNDEKALSVISSLKIKKDDSSVLQQNKRIDERGDLALLVKKLKDENRGLRATINKRSHDLLNIMGRISWDDEYFPEDLGISEDDPFHDSFYAISLMQNDIREMVASLRDAKDVAESASLAKSQFLSTITHELRTPLNGIMGMVELSLMTKLTKEQKNYLDIAFSSAKSLLFMVNEILDFSKVEAGKLSLNNSQLDIKVLLKNLSMPYKIQAEKKGLEFSLHISPDVPEFIMGDMVRISQVLTNLMDNALKFTHEGEISISLDILKSETGKEILKFQVKDTGIGISKDKQQLIFSPFMQIDSSISRKYAGTGLGLAIANNLATLMNGRIQIQSRLKKGSLFTFTMPYL